MPRFPTTEAEIIALCQQIIAGLPGSSFTGASITDAELQTQLNKFIAARNTATASEAAWRADIVAKDAELETLIELIKTVLRHAENIAKGNKAQLNQIGWDARAAATDLEKPEQPRVLEAPKQGDGWVFLDWKEPLDSGAVAFYKIRRRERPAGDWEDIGSTIPSEAALIEQPKGKELEYVVISVNRAGESTPSNAVMVVL